MHVAIWIIGPDNSFSKGAQEQKYEICVGIGMYVFTYCMY